MFYLVLIYTSVKLTFITQTYVIFLLAVLGHHILPVFRFAGYLYHARIDVTVNLSPRIFFMFSKSLFKSRAFE